MIPYAKQNIDDADVASVVEVLRSDFLTQGPVLEKFERRISEYCGVRHAVAVSSGTAGLHLVCSAIGLEPDDCLWTSPISFVASSNCALHCGAKVDFVDIESETGNLSAERLAEKLQVARDHGHKAPRIIVPVHYAGQPCELAEIEKIARCNGIFVLEDAAQALGATYRGSPIGNCAFSDCAVFSSHAIKSIATGEGGIVVTNNNQLAAKVRRLRSHGITRIAAEMEAIVPEPWYYEQHELGFNYRMTDIQAALGLSQLDRLPIFMQARRSLADRYDQLLAGTAINCLSRRPNLKSSCHFYPVILDPSRCKRSRSEVYNSMRADGVGVNVHYIPIHLQPFYRKMGFKPGDFPIAENFFSHEITLPLFYGLTKEEQDYVVDSLIKAVK